MADKNFWKQILHNEGAQSVLFGRLSMKKPDTETLIALLKINGDLILEQRSFLERTIDVLHSDESLKREDMLKSIKNFIEGGEYNYLSKMKGLEELEKTIDISI